MWMREEIAADRILELPAGGGVLAAVEGACAGFAERRVARVGFLAYRAAGDGAVARDVAEFEDSLERGAAAAGDRGGPVAFEVPWRGLLALQKKHAAFTRSELRRRFARELAWTVLGAPLLLPVAAVLGAVGFGLRVLPRAEVAFFPAHSPHAPAPGHGGRRGAEAASQLPPSRLRVMTLNVALTEFEIMNEINGMPTTHARLGGLAGVLAAQDADVVCLQEAFDVGRLRGAVFEPMQARGYDVLVQARRARYFGMSSGLALLSRHAVVLAGFHPFAERRGHDALARKGCLAAVLRLRGDPRHILVATTHVQAGFTVTDEEAVGGAAKDAVRATLRGSHLRQCREFCAAMVARAESEGIAVADVVLCGDLNTSIFDRMERPFAGVSYDWELVQSRLVLPLPDAPALFGFKDLTVPARDLPFAAARVPLAHDPYTLAGDAAVAVSEAGENRGTSVRCESTVAIFLPEVLRLEARERGVTEDALLPELLDLMYVEPAVLDHVLLADRPNNVFSEVGYEYRAFCPGTKRSLLSDHRAVVVTLNAREPE